ncbi:MAG: hypothetical protein J2P55_00060 [Rhizobiales bacterium]|nr:hypothetical protein [Hyphomicrobiales bacterium]
MSAFHQDTEVTPVIFRKYGPRKGDDVIALFPAEIGTCNDVATCSSYVHVGQHGIAALHYVINATRPAKPDEYADLFRELEAPPYGYRLKVYQRVTRQHDAARRKQADDLRKGRE